MDKVKTITRRKDIPSAFWIFWNEIANEFGWSPYNLPDNPYRSNIDEVWEKVKTWYKQVNKIMKEYVQAGHTLQMRTGGTDYRHYRQTPEYSTLVNKLYPTKNPEYLQLAEDPW